MNKVISSLLLICFMSNAALADCDWSKIEKKEKTYVYSEELHLCVGQLVQSNKTKDTQIADLTKAIQLKDLAIQKADERVALWMDTSFKMEDRLNKIDSLRSSNNTLYYGLGIATAILAVWAAGQLR